MSKAAHIKELSTEIERLKADLFATREKNGIYMNLDECAQPLVRRICQRSSHHAVWGCWRGWGAGWASTGSLEQEEYCTEAQRLALGEHTWDHMTPILDSMYGEEATDHRSRTEDGLRLPQVQLSGGGAADAAAGGGAPGGGGELSGGRRPAARRRAAGTAGGAAGAAGRDAGAPGVHAGEARHGVAESSRLATKLLSKVES